jgi:hypothetical protein
MAAWNISIEFPLTPLVGITAYSLRILLPRKNNNNSINHVMSCAMTISPVAHGHGVTAPTLTISRSSSIAWHLGISAVRKQ